MITHFKLIFGSFIGFGSGNEYVKNGKNSGKGILATLALLFCLFMVFSTASAMKFMLNKEEMRATITEFADKKLPPMVIEKGEFQWDKKEIRHFELDKDVLMTVDMVNDEPTLSQVGKSVIYITKKTLYVNDQSKNRIQPIEFKDIQSAFGDKRVDLKSPEVINMGVMLAQYVFWIMVGFILLFCFLSFWLANVWLAVFVKIVATWFEGKIGDMDYYAVRRLAAISAVPAIVVMDAINYAVIDISWWARWGLIIFAGALIMTARYKKLDPAEVARIE